MGSTAIDMDSGELHIVSGCPDDEDGYMVDSGNIYLSALSEGDKSKDNSLVQAGNIKNFSPHDGGTG